MDGSSIRVREAGYLDWWLAWVARDRKDPLLRHIWWHLRRVRHPSYLVFELKSEPVAYARIDGIVLSYAVIPAHRHRGLGEAIVRYVTRTRRGRLVAWVKCDNVASRKIFERTGWKEWNSLSPYGMVLYEKVASDANRSPTVIDLPDHHPHRPPHDPGSRPAGSARHRGGE